MPEQNSLISPEFNTLEDRFINIVTALPTGILIYRLESKERLVFYDANPAAGQILGVDTNQFIGKTIEEAYPPLSGTEVPERYREAASKGTPWYSEQINYKDEQIEGAYEVHAFQISPGFMAAAFTEVTNYLKAEKSLRRERDLSIRYHDAVKGLSLGKQTGNLKSF